MTLGTLFEDDSSISDFEKTDVILIIDLYYSCNCTSELGATGWSIEIIASVGTNQQAFGNASDRACIQN
jgi:hypothetical protein